MEHRRETDGEREARQVGGALPHDVREEPERTVGLFYDREAMNPEKMDELRRDAKEEGIQEELVELMLGDPGIFKAVIRDDMKRDLENLREFIRTAATLKRLARVPDHDRK